MYLQELYYEHCSLVRHLYGEEYNFKIFLYRLEKKHGKFDSIIARGKGAFEHMWLFNQKNYYQFIESPLPSTDKRFLNKIYGKARFSEKIQSMADAPINVPDTPYIVNVARLTPQKISNSYYMLLHLLKHYTN